MKKAVISLFLIACCSVICGQTESDQKDFHESLKSLIKYYKDDAEKELKEQIIKHPGAYKLIELSDKPIYLKIKEIVLMNPYGDDFPVSNSIIYKGMLISLFQSGLFTCHSIQSMERDFSFESKINSKKFDYHWLIDNKLVGLSNGKYFYLNSADKWVKYKKIIPLWDQPKLFEDDKYIVFCDCKGEWGGTVYFFNKTSGKIYFTEATCANTAYKEDNKYYVLSYLGHLLRLRSTLKEIPDPDLLTPISLEEIRKFQQRRELDAIGYSDKSNASRIVFNLNPITLSSTFNYKGRTIYLANSLGKSFLAELENDSIKIVNPLFNNDIIIHPLGTTIYSNTILINRAWYMIGKEREISFFIIKDDEFIKIDWNEKR